MLQIIWVLVMGRVCSIHHCFPSMEMEQAVMGSMAGRRPMKTGRVFPTMPDMPSMDSTGSTPMNRIAAAISSINRGPIRVLVTYTVEEK